MSAPRTFWAVAAAVALGATPLAAQQPVEVRHVSLDLLDMTLVADTVLGTSIVAAPSVRSKQGVDQLHLVSLDFTPDSLVEWLNVAAAYLRAPARAGAPDGIRWAPPLHSSRRDGEISLGRQIRKGKLRETTHLAIGDSTSRWAATLDVGSAERLLLALLAVASRSRLVPTDSSLPPDSLGVCTTPDEAIGVVSQPVPSFPGSEGRVVVQYVVGTDGRADMSTFHVLLAPHQRHAEVARKTIADSRFRPARIGGAPVRSLARQSLVFRVR
jgi:hypothetical protein